MQLTVLGCWAPYPRAGGACPGYLLQAGTTNLLLDCGNGVLGNLQKHLDFRKLTGVVISHLHPDHYYDIFCLRHALGGAKRDGSRPESLELWLPEGPSEAREQLARYQDVFLIKAITAQNRAGQGWLESQVGECKLQFMPTEHPLPCYAAAVEFQGKRIVYTADTGWTARLVPFLRGADLLLCEASLQEADAAYAAAGHLTAGQAGELAQQAGVRKLALTHFWPEYNLAVTKQEAQRAFDGVVDLAAEGKVWKVE
ncbi:MAG: MBL fold metallo-hydrolase [Clostridia bacterium]|nr:MBL fold metallo-hydrolase [Clostridia bacterium]